MNTFNYRLSAESAAGLTPAIRIIDRLLQGFDIPFALRLWNDINRYVFPDGELDLMSNMQLDMERAGFEIHDVEGLRPHYAMTLRHWVKRLEAHRDVAVREVGEPAYRIWRLYMAACALEFESGGTGVYQILASRPDSGKWPVPLTRRDLYARV